MNSKPISHKIVSGFFAFALLAVSLMPFTYAQAEMDICNPPKSIFQSIADILTKDIRYTVMNFFASFILDIPMQLLTGHETSQVMGCTTYIAQGVGADPRIIDTPDLRADTFVNSLEGLGCNSTSSDEVTCPNLLNMHDVADAGGNYDRKRLSSNKVNGSLLGLAYFMENSLRYEPLPVNTAYFFKDYAHRLPVIGEKAFAADITSNGADYRHSLINAAMDAWKISRSASYAFMALIMLYVGIAIILRKQVNQKLVVTIQYALPKVFITLLLIAFSYPIGALIASLAWTLFHSAHSIVVTLGQTAGVQPILIAFLQFSAGGSLGMILVLLLILAAVIPGFNIAFFLTLAIVVLVMGVLYLLMMFKAVMLYLKMIVGIITAPIEFAFGAIPGNEDKTMAWFKRMAAYALGVVGMAVTQQIVYLFGFSVIITLFDIAFNNWSGDSFFTGALFLLFGAPLIFIFGFSYAMKIPGEIENAIVGKPRR